MKRWRKGRGKEGKMIFKKSRKNGNRVFAHGKGKKSWSKEE